MTVPVHDLPLVLDAGMRVHLVPPSLKGPRSLVVSSCVDGLTGQLVSFEGVDGIDVASELVGKVVLVSQKDLPPDFSLHDVMSLVGREVTDVRAGSLGSIAEVMLGVANDVWVVRGPHGEVLVPVVDEFVVNAEGDGAIVVALPDGLVEGE